MIELPYGEDTESGPPGTFPQPPAGGKPEGGTVIELPLGEDTEFGPPGTFPLPPAGGTPEGGFVTEPPIGEGPPPSGTSENNVACQALAKALEERAQIGQEMQAVATRQSEIGQIYEDERATILSENKAEAEQVKRSWSRLGSLFVELYNAREQERRDGLSTTDFTGRMRSLDKTLDNLRNLYDELQVAGKERLFRAYENYINKVAPLWNRTAELTLRANALDAQIAVLASKC